MPQTLRCLVIGIPEAVFPEWSIRPEAAASIAFAELAQYRARFPALELVVAPLFCGDFDALEIIETLGAAGYRGLLRITTPTLPNRQIVLRELRSHAVKQGLTIELVEQPPQS
jgi:hypothetical protein